jgi:hypothetical protein
MSNEIFSEGAKPVYKPEVSTLRVFCKTRQVELQGKGKTYSKFRADADILCNKAPIIAAMVRVGLVVGTLCSLSSCLSGRKHCAQRIYVIKTVFL